MKQIMPFTLVNADTVILEPANPMQTLIILFADIDQIVSHVFSGQRTYRIKVKNPEYFFNTNFLYSNREMLNGAQAAIYEFPQPAITVEDLKATFERIQDTSIGQRTPMYRLLGIYNRLNQPIRNTPETTANMYQEVADLLQDMECLDSDLFEWYNQFIGSTDYVILAANLVACYSSWKQFLLWYSLRETVEVEYLCRQYIKDTIESLKTLFATTHTYKNQLPKLNDE